METTDDVVKTEPDNSFDTPESSADKSWDSEKYPAWQKSIGKEYWGNEKLKDFGSMKDVMESIVNPKAKAPEKYDLKLDGDFSEVEKAFRDADLPQDKAEEIAKAFSSKLAKNYTLENLKDGYGADYEQADIYVGKAIEKLCNGNEKLTKAIEERKNDPAMFEVLRLVGQNLGEGTNLNLGRKDVKPEKKGTGDVFTDLILGYEKGI